MGTEQRFLTVTALTRYIKKKFETDRHLQDIWFKGEISNFKFHSRGHMYFTLKDENARIPAVMFAGQNRYLKFRPEDGMKVLVRGQISVYEPMGSYQVYVKEMQPDGIGNLYLAYEELKKKLEQEGLFAPERKKQLPKTPLHVGVITSPTGAAVRDILTTIKRRFPVAKVTILPVQVQGENAAPSIVSAIRKANELDFLDVLIVGRGGGSIEDLWAFNEEMVAREIFASRLPIISAVGHETDFTIADFVADVRAATPTGAAELAVPLLEELLDRVDDRTKRLRKALTDLLKNRQEKLTSLQKSYAFKYPMQLISQKEQELDRTIDRLERSRKQYLERNVEKWKNVNHRLLQNHPYEKVANARDKQHQMKLMLYKEFMKVMKEKQFGFQRAVAQLNALSPLKVMERGFSVVYKEETELIKSVKQVQPGDAVKVKLKDGHLDCHVWGVEE